jgi:hypothetical protein
MGLDIDSYRHCRFVQPLTKLCHDGECPHFEDDYLRHFFPNDLVFRHNSPGFTEGVYQVSFTDSNSSDNFGFRAGSYSDYNLWREWLCQFATGESYSEFWLPANFVALMTGETESSPFWELFNMSDYEGIITGTVAKKLLQDFDIHKPRALAWKPTKPIVRINWITGTSRVSEEFDPSYWIEQYDLWTQALRVASTEGVLVFC